jgi:hypothetical protein
MGHCNIYQNNFGLMNTQNKFILYCFQWFTWTHAVCASESLARLDLPEVDRGRPTLWQCYNSFFFQVCGTCSSLTMSKRPTEPDSSHQVQKKTKANPVFRSAVPRVALTANETANETRSSRSASRSTVITLSKNEDGRRRASGRYRNRTHTSKDPFPDPSIEARDVPDSSEPPTVTPETRRKRNNNTAVSH